MRWLPRTLISSPHLTLCLNEKEYIQAVRHCKINEHPPWVSELSDATTHIWQNDKRTVTIVCIRPRKDRAEAYGILVHEAVHVWQQAMKDLNESAPGEEVEAVGIQGIAQQLIEEYMRRKK